MKTIYDPVVREEVIRRIRTLSDNASPQWGRMTLYQMLKHCRLWEEMAQGHTHYKRAFMGLLFGRLALRQVLKDDSPLRHSTPTMPGLIIAASSGNIPEEKSKWVTLIAAYAQTPHQGLDHPFFGKMTAEQVGWMAYKHSDHHLRQFGG